MQKGLFNISNIQPVFDYTVLYDGGWLFDLEYGCDIFFREIRGCVWSINSKEKVIIVTLTELLFQIDHVYC